MKAQREQQKRSKRSRRQSGFGLIEVLVAVLVFSAGLLGLAQLMTRSMAINNSAMARSMATMYTYSIVDAIKIDDSNLASYQTTVYGNDCPAADNTLAGDQVHQWCDSLAHTFGATKATVGTVACKGDTCTVTVQFDDSKAGPGGSDTQKITTKVVL